MSSIFIVAAKRTPFGAFGGSLKALSATELGAISTKAALSSANIDPSLVDAVYFGNVIQSSPDAAYLARHVGLKCGVPIPTPALTINRLCGSGFETVIQGAKSIKLNEASIVVCGGSENMSMAPLQVDGNDARWGVALGKGLTMRDSLWDGLTDKYVGTPMGITAENLAEQYGITRQDCDEFAIRSQQTWVKAHKNGVFDLEMANVEIETKKGPKIIGTDEHPRPDTSLEQIASLRPVFKKDGVVTAANASGICDGAGTIILASEEAVREHGLQPLARLASYHVSGCDPSIMGIGPVSAIKGALESAGMTLADVDRMEINEAFAAQFLACAKALELDMDKTNLHGGAISFGHPLGASGSRITAHLANEFLRTDAGKVHVGSACIGGGQGIAVVLERV
ncbi:3-ketoacyl-coa thiolase, mitochondrial [Thalassiosira pseudonana CCMP1335]|uniref:3-ketoacyl-coa thiolase, mitochondrial n=1 Tax=Thalassiosira pseudonana TaxID=35128 RepID=B8C459_THAPS|nr:3-ketoacyl-coa thiolase, mitochondrial [Thalassiosira pseudonana CCMP1335]EED91664.1 3-ketoacyl-coa thiolase, mitochondrial [Thalassiosira pseudonana CCMP1335]